MNTDLKELNPDRPNIITTEIDAISFYRKMDAKATIEEMIEGKYVIVEEFYSNGLDLLVELRRTLLETYSDSSFQGQRDYRSAFRKASHRLLIKVENNTLAVKKCPDIGWLKQLYPDVSDFYISYPEVQGMNSSWQWYEKGLKVKTLNLSLHPYYGTYFPTRFDHIVLFDKWLTTYKGSKKKAVDIGVGCGVLSFQLVRKGFKNIFASDTNKNAIIGVAKELNRLDFNKKIDLSHGDLFDTYEDKADLIVFNPPWLLAKHELEEGIDRAMYYEDGLFDRFFEEAKKHLAEDGKLVLIFSNLAQVVDRNAAHPIKDELENNSRFKLETFLQSDVKGLSQRTRRSSQRSNEKVELWVLTAKE